MARKKKVVEETIPTVAVTEEPVELKLEEYMNPPEEEITSGYIEAVEEKPLRKVIKFTPVGPKIEYI